MDHRELPRLHLCRRATIAALFAVASAIATAAPLTPTAGTTADWALADTIVDSIHVTTTPDRDYVVTDFGARPDGVSDARPAIQAAIKQASGDGGDRVVIPRGTWLSLGPIHHASRINLHVAEGVNLLFSPDPKRPARSAHALGRHGGLHPFAADLRV